MQKRGGSDKKIQMKLLKQEYKIKSSTLKSISEEILRLNDQIFELSKKEQPPRDNGQMITDEIGTKPGSTNPIVEETKKVEKDQKIVEQ